MSLRLRITAVATLVVGVAMAAVAGGIVWAVEHRLEGRARDDVTLSLEHAADQLRQGELDRLRLAAGPGAAPHVEVFDPEGRVLFRREDTAMAPAEVRALAPPPVPLPPGGPVLLQAPAAGLAGTDMLLGYRAVSTPDGVFTVVAANPLTEVIRGVDSVVQALMFAMPALLAVVAGLVWLLVGRALRPIEAMRREVEDITHSTLDRRVEHPGTGDEVGRLAGTLNGMLDRLHDAVRRQREFVSDASHELRSPLASVRTMVEVSLRDPVRTDWAGLGQEVLSETARLEELVDDLLLAARLEEGALRLEELDFDALVQAECRRARDGAAIQTRLTPARVRGDAAQLRRAVSNLLDNAVRHAASSVVVTLRRRSGELVLTVDDDGPGIAGPERERVFQRFARAQEGRERRSGGAGLGLALVRRVAEAHGGSATADEAPGGGARLVLALPAPPD